MQPTDTPYDLVITIDTREERSSLCEILNRQNIFEISRKQLVSGDIVIGELGIERKTARDFVDSLQSGRLFRQLILLKRSFFRRLLIIEGGIDRMGMPQKQLQGALLRIVGSLNIPILYTLSVEDTAQKIEHLAVQLLVYRAGQIRERSVKDQDTRAFYQRYILAGIPGIGVVRAKALLEKFGSLQGVFNADVSQLSEVNDIGPVNAHRIVSLARGEVKAGNV